MSKGCAGTISTLCHWIIPLCMTRSLIASTRSASTKANPLCSFETSGPTTNLTPNLRASFGSSTDWFVTSFRIVEFAVGHWSGVCVITKTNWVIARPPGRRKVRRALNPLARRSRPVGAARRDGRLVGDDPELVPVSVREHERRAPILLPDRARDLDPVLAESRLLPHDVLRREQEPSVSLFGACVRTEVETDARGPRRDRVPVRPRRHDPESGLVLPPLCRLLLVPDDDRDGLEREHEHGNPHGRPTPASRMRWPRLRGTRSLTSSARVGPAACARRPVPSPRPPP